MSAKRLDNILQNLTEKHLNGVDLTPEEKAKQQCEWSNSSEGNLHEKDGYNCDICKNKGFVYEVRQDTAGGFYEVAIPCKCEKIRQTLNRAKRSGLGNILTDYTFDKFETPEEFHRTLKDKAQEFCMDDNAKIFYIGGQSGCVDESTEYFDGKEWRKISAYSGGEVLQYNPDTKEATLTNPKRYIAVDSEMLYKITTKRGSINQVLSADHNFAYYTSKGNMTKKPFREVMRLHNENVQGFYGRIETAFKYDGDGIELTDNEIRIMCAVIADGCFKQKLKLCCVNIKKERKKERMRELLKGMQYKEYQKSNGYSEFRFYAPRREKVFSKYWYGCNNKQLQVIADEVFKWDGSIDSKNRHSFFTTEKESADFVQFAISATGKRATITEDNHRKKVCYTVHLSAGQSTVSMVSSGGRTKAQITEYKPVDGKQYCFEVETGYLVLRRNGRIFITGNSGKTHLCTAIAGHYIKQGKDCRYMLWRDDAVKLKQCVNDYAVYQPLINEFKNVDVLYIDDLFKSANGDEMTPPTKADINIAFEIVNHRILDKDKITIISSEFTMEQALDFDEATMGRIYQPAKDYTINIGKDRQKNWRLR